MIDLGVDVDPSQDLVGRILSGSSRPSPPDVAPCCADEHGLAPVEDETFAAYL
jgi:hypothetical protein